MAHNTYLIFGDDDYLVATRAKALMKKLSAGQPELGLEVLDAHADTGEEAQKVLQRCLEAVRTPGLFQRSRIIWLRDATFLGDIGPGRSEAVRSLLAALVEILKKGLMPGLYLLVTARVVDKRFSFYRVFREVGDVFELEIPKRFADLRRRAEDIVREECEARGLVMDELTIQTLLEKTGFDTRQIVNEIEKLRVCLGEERNRVTPQDIRMVVSASRTVAVWDLTDAFGQRDLPLALTTLRQLLFQKESPIRLLMNLESRVRELLVYREALEQGWLRFEDERGKSFPTPEWGTLPAQVEKMFVEQLDRDPRSVHPYRVFILAAQARNFSREKLLACQRVLVRAHEQLVTTGLPAGIVLEAALVRMLS
ncbi:MAG: DNA polymerase III subunit delta [Kiritimatiellia bacterium]